MNNIRNYKPLKRNFSSHIQKPNVVNRYGDTFVDQKEVLLNDNSMKLLDDYSASNNLQDPFSGVARGRSGYMLERNKSFNNVYKRSDLDDTEIMPDLIPNQKAMVFDPNPNYQNPNNISINPMYPTPIQQPQINPYQNPYMPQMNPYGYPYGNMMQNNFPFFNQPMGMGGGYYPQFPPQQQQQESNKKETDIISAHIEKQAQILEALSKRLDGSPKERKRSRGESREFETRMRELERENELKIQLIKQKQVIDNLMNGQGNPDMGNLGQRKVLKYE